MYRGCMQVIISIATQGGAEGAGTAPDFSVHKDQYTLIEQSAYKIDKT